MLLICNLSCFLIYSYNLPLSTVSLPLWPIVFCLFVLLFFSTHYWTQSFCTELHPQPCLIFLSRRHVEVWIWNVPRKRTCSEVGLWKDMWPMWPIADLLLRSGVWLQEASCWGVAWRGSAPSPAPTISACFLASDSEGDASSFPLPPFCRARSAWSQPTMDWN